MWMWPCISCIQLYPNIHSIWHVQVLYEVNVKRIERSKERERGERALNSLLVPNTHTHTHNGHTHRFQHHALQPVSKLPTHIQKLSNRNDFGGMSVMLLIDVHANVWLFANTTLSYSHTISYSQPHQCLQNSFALYYCYVSYHIILLR